VRIDIPWLNENLRNRLNREAGPSVLSGALTTFTSAPEADERSPAGKLFFGNYHWFAQWASRFPALASSLTRSKTARWALERVFGLDRRRALPPFPPKSLVAASGSEQETRIESPVARAALFPDVFTNYGMVERGLATLRVLRAAGVDVMVTDSLPDGRAALSQGLLATAKEFMQRAAGLLDAQIQQGRDIVVVEPSSLAMFRRDARHLLDDSQQFDRLRSRTFEPVEYVARILRQFERQPRLVFDASRSPVGTRLFYHSHCQQKTIGAAAATEELLRAIGFDVVSSTVECCGMAGSFGYKKDFYELSAAVGEDLFDQVRRAEEESAPRALVASGTSCTEQLRTGFDHREVLHPIELLAAILRD
jgi:Fe-S oxidoreductase